MTLVCLSCGHVQHRKGDSCEKCWADNLAERSRPKVRPERDLVPTMNDSRGAAE